MEILRCSHLTKIYGSGSNTVQLRLMMSVFLWNGKAHLDHRGVRLRQINAASHAGRGRPPYQRKLLY